MAHFLNRDGMRVVERNDRGNVTYRKRYKRGDEVDTSHIDDAQVENLVEKGALVGSKEEVAARGQAPAPIPGSLVTGAATGEAADHSEIADSADYEDDETDPAKTEAVYVDGANTAVTSDGTAEEGDDDGEVVDEYSEMDYSQLRSAAKDKGLDTSGNTQDLRTRLRNA